MHHSITGFSLGGNWFWLILIIGIAKAFNL